MRALVAGLPGLVDVLAFVGVVLVSVGAGLAYLPAGLITAGVLLIAGATLHARGEVPGKTRDELRAQVTR